MKYLMIRTYWDGTVHAYEFSNREAALNTLNRDVVKDVVINSALLQKDDDDVVWKPFDQEVQA